MKRLTATVEREAAVVERTTITLAVPGFLSPETQEVVMREFLKSLDVEALQWRRERYLIEDRPSPSVIQVRETTGGE
jgi:hypothetical protein